MNAFGIAGIVVTAWAFWPYVRDILRDRLRPHVFSWILWATTTLIVFAAQLRAGGGAGAWVIGISGATSTLIALLAFLKRSDTTTTRADWAFFIAALCALPVWAVTRDPLWAVALLTLVDLLGFGPSLRRGWHDPERESAGFFALFLLRNALAVGALERVSWTTALFPAAIGAACGAMTLLILLRRREVARARAA